jgi:putative membrane protein
MRFFLIVILLVLAVVFGIVFTVFNAEKVPVNLYFSHFDLPLATVVFLAVLFGVLLGFVMILGVVLKKQAEIVKLKRRFVSLEQEVDNLRKIPIKDTH